MFKGQKSDSRCHWIKINGGSVWLCFDRRKKTHNWFPSLSSKVYFTHSTFGLANRFLRAKEDDVQVQLSPIFNFGCNLACVSYRTVQEADLAILPEDYMKFSFLRPIPWRLSEVVISRWTEDLPDAYTVSKDLRAKKNYIHKRSIWGSNIKVMMSL